MRSYFLAKTEPQSYSIDHLKADLRTFWDGIRNPQALRAVKAMKPGDRVLIYHSGGESALVGMAEVIGLPEPDPADPKLTRVEIQYLRHLDPPTSFSEIKASGKFAEWALVRQPRLSTMAVPDEVVQWLRERYGRSTI